MTPAERARDADDERRWGEEPFRPAASTTSATLFCCPLCGMRFQHGERVCGSCPLGAGCDIVRCPACGYAFPRSSRIVTWLARALERVRRRGR